MNLNEVYTLKEASELWKISDSNLRNAIVKFNRFDQQIKEGTVKKSCGTWLVTRQAMIQVFGYPKREEKKMTKLDELFNLIDENERKLGDAELQQEGSRLIIIDDTAESSDDAFVWEGYSVYEAYDFLDKNKFLK